MDTIRSDGERAGARECGLRSSGDPVRPGRAVGRWRTCLLVLASCGLAGRAAADDVAALRARLQASETAGARVLAPATYDRAAKAVTAAGSSKSAQRTDEAAKRLTELEGAVERARTLWAHPLDKRAAAKAAGADTAAVASWHNAENILEAAARKLEAGRRDAAERQATSLTALYDQAHKEAVHQTLVGGTRALLAAAERDKAGEYTPRSYVRALDAVESTEKQIEAGDMGDAAQAEAARARREAEHARFLLDTIRDTCEGQNRARLESIVLDWEAQAQRVLDAFGVQGDFKQGMGPALQQAQVEADRVVRERNRLRIDLARRTDQVDSLQRVIDELKGHVRDFEGLVAELEPFRQEANTVDAVRGLFMQSEGRVLVDNRDVVLRLHGLGFPSGSAKLPPESVPLLEKVVEAVRAFPGARLVVEGHTDAKGNPDKNLRLSTERANAVRDWLVQQGSIAAERITAVGQGSKQPVASNDTEEGRSLNRRIEVIIARTD